MKKKIYNAPLIELTECVTTGHLCDVSPGSSTPGSGDVGNQSEKPGSTSAPGRKVF